MAQEPEHLTLMRQAWARQIADVVGNKKAVEIMRLAELNGLLDPFKVGIESRTPVCSVCGEPAIGRCNSTSVHHRTE